MSNKTLNDYICVSDDEAILLKNDSLEDFLDYEDKKGAPQRKRNVRKAIERHLERKRLKQQISDFDLGSAF